MTTIRHNWIKEDINQIYHTPLLELIYQAATIHHEFHRANHIKLNTLISVKTGACIEDCSYCAQSSRYQTHVEPHELLDINKVIRIAETVKDNGVPRVCLSASWSEVPGNKHFDNVLQMVDKLRVMGLEVCCTMGKLSKEQAVKLKAAGVTAYNHNIDTSKEFYNKIITTRTFEDRLDTLDNLVDAGMNYCSGGIIGLGETVDDRISMLHTLASRNVHPFTLPLNMLIPVNGTPLENNEKVSAWDMIRVIATARMIMPATIICLAAGRLDMSDEAQALCFMAGANSIFIGTKLLTCENPSIEHDMNLLKLLGLEQFKKEETLNEIK